MTRGQKAIFTVIAVVGGKKSGKTTTIEILIKELTRRGYNVAAIKHIPEPNFTIDREGKDTWRFAQSGAKTVVGVSSDEIATIEKVDSSKLTLKEILKRCRWSDIVFLEGFRELASKDRGIHKIVVVKSADDVLRAEKNFNPIVAFTGPYLASKMKLKAPYVDVLRHPTEIADLVEKIVGEERAT